jgi:ribosomal-protein-serine acetyltransferase
MSAAIRESTDTIGKWMYWAKPDFSDYDALIWFEQCNWARATGEAHEFGIFTRDGSFIDGYGLNQISRQNKLCNQGYWVRQSHQRRWAATEATIALRDLAFTSLNLWRVEIVIAVGNTPSMGVAQKAAAHFDCIARNRLQIHGKPTDAHVYSFVRHFLD